MSAEVTINSSDPARLRRIVGSSYASVVDRELTKGVDGDLVRSMHWYGKP